ncbi:MAG: GTP-binding protein [Chthoniobacterales bacterium]
MLLPDPSPPLRATLLAGPNRALRGPIVEQLIADLSPQLVTVLSFDHERCTIERNSRVHFRRAESKRIKITQSGLVVPFRADLFIELQAIARERSSDHVVIELDSSDELPTAHDSLVHRFPGGIDLRSIVRLTRSILVMPANGLFEWFWTDAAAAEPEDTADTHSEGGCSQGHSLSRSIECADTVVITDRQAMDPATLQNAIRLIRALNPKTTIADQTVKPLTAYSQPMSEDENSNHDDACASVARLQLRWIVADTRGARVRVSVPRPIHPKRFVEFVREGWRGVIRGRGEIRLASQPGTHRLWSQAGKVGVLGSKNASASAAWQQDLTLVGPPDACMEACRNFDASLLSDEELELGPRLWRSFVDPFKEG